jgi:hypothetical protein
VAQVVECLPSKGEAWSSSQKKSIIVLIPHPGFESKIISSLLLPTFTRIVQNTFKLT